ncbi:phosphoglycolate phosphatase [Microbaculum marinum]|uniref:Phosphoglycolate phosphatase n=1 Tax=Microbaculum marinum TaxID=1764581 RepID=A0AAW9RYE2_9HYPH
MPKPVAVFDLDGTLVDTAPDLFAALDVVLRENGYESVAPADEMGIIGHGSKAMIEYALTAQGVDIDPERIKPMHLRFLDYYEAHIADGSRPFPGVVEALDRLAGAGAALAVCTNKYEHLSRQLLDALGLSGRFAAIVGADTLGVRKPDPAHILGTIERAGGDLTRAVMVGDSRTDIDAAKAATVPVIAVDFGYTDTPVAQLSPDHVISQYEELYALAAPRLGLAGA